MMSHDLTIRACASDTSTHFLHAGKMENLTYTRNVNSPQLYYTILTRILKLGVWDSLFIKSRSPSQKVGLPLPKNRSHICFHDSLLIVSKSTVTSFYKYLMENQFPYFHTFCCCCFFLLFFFFQLILVSALCIILSNACNQLLVIITHPDVVN